MSELLQMRPKLKQDTVFFQTPEGVYLRSDEAMFYLKGKFIYRWVSVLSPYFTGEHTIAELCRELEPEQATFVLDIVQTLTQKGILQDYEPEQSTLAAEVRQRFQAQIALIDHYGPHALAHFQAFRESRILLVGRGEIFLSAGTALLDNGLRQLFLAPTRQEAHYQNVIDRTIERLQPVNDTNVTFLSTDNVTDLENFDLVVYCADDVELAELAAWQKRCLASQKRFVPAYAFADTALLGPLSRPDAPGCWMCSMLRYSTHCDEHISAEFWKTLAIGTTTTDFTARISTPLARRLGTGLAFELFKILAGYCLSEIENGLFLQDTLTLETRRRRYAPHPQCPLCSQLHQPDLVQRLMELVAGQHDQQMDLDELFAQSRRLIDNEFGAFGLFDDEQQQQVPLKSTRLQIGTTTMLATRPAIVNAYSIDNIQQARYAAYTQGIMRYSQNMVSPHGLLIASYTECAQSEIKAIAEERFALWTSLQAADRERTQPWLPAYSLLNNQIYYVPAALVYPDSRFNRDGAFERTQTGYGVEQTFVETSRNALLSAYAYDRLSMLWEQGIPRVQSLSMQIFAEAEGEVDLRFLARVSQHFSQSISVLEVLHEAPVHILFARAIDEKQQVHTRAGIGLSGPEAAVQCLRALIGDLQRIEEGETLSAYDQDPFHLFTSRMDLQNVETEASRFKQAAITHMDIQETLRRQGREIFFVDTTPADIQATQTLMSGRILLSK